MFEKFAMRAIPKTEHLDLGDGIELDVRHMIGLTEMMTLTHDIVDTCVNEERGEVHFEIFDYVTKLFICAMYCNISAPQNHEVGYRAVCGVDQMYDKIAPYINADQLNNIWASAKEKIMSKRDMFNSAAAKITIDMLQRMNELYEMMSSATEGFDDEKSVNAMSEILTLCGGKE